MIKSKKYYLAKTKVQPVNTYIGGVSATISSAATLATKLRISVGIISNFSVIGSNIQCAISGSYVIPINAFYNDTSITYYYDIDGLVTSFGLNVFYGCSNFTTAKFKNVTVVPANAFRSTKLSGTDNDFSSVSSISSYSFATISSDPGTVISMPSLTTISGSNSFNGHTTLSNNLSFNVPLGLKTINSGKPHSELTTNLLKAVNINYLGYVEDLTYNTAIGGYQGLYANKGLFANRLGVGSGAIVNFRSDSLDVKFKMLINYTTSSYSFNTSITYYYDIDGLVTSLAVNSFYGCSNFTTAKFKNVTVVPVGAFRSTKLSGTDNDFSSVTTISGNDSFYSLSSLPGTVIEFLNLATIGTTLTNNNVFFNITSNVTLRVPVALQTINGGSPEGDLVYAAGRGVTIVYI